MKVVTLIVALMLTVAAAFADHHDEGKKNGHDKEHQHVAEEKKDHEHEEEHHKPHDHKAHHPEHEDSKAKPKK